MINIVVAKASNNIIGNKNELIWHLPIDLKRFKDITYGHPIIMGRKTYESISKPLPNRTNIVVTKEYNWNNDDIITEHSINEAIETALEIDKDIYIIGGESVYKQTIELADNIYVTEVHQEFHGDTFFPDIDFNYWKEINRENFYKDDKHMYDFSFVTYTRR